MAKHEKMYKDTPEMKRDEDSGKMKVSKPAKESAKVSEGADGLVNESGMAAPARHAQERRDMHNRHETEHSIHDAGASDKKEMHGRHVKELADMHKRHEKEGIGGEKATKPAEKK